MAELIQAPNLIHSKSSSGSKRFQKDKFSILHEESLHHKLDMVHLEIPSKSTITESPRIKLDESLQQEIPLLEKQLETQVEVRRELESALGYTQSSSNHDTDTTLTPESVAKLVEDIAMLELEVGHLEQYLLSLYRSAFDQLQEVPPSPQTGKNPKPAVSFQKDNTGVKARCQSSICQLSGFVRRMTPEKMEADYIRSCYSQPLLTTTGYGQNSANSVSLAEHLSKRITDHRPETPNKLSEDMIRCMSAIYCKLSDSAQTHPDLSSSNSTSLMRRFSPQNHDGDDSWSTGLVKYSSMSMALDLSLETQLHVDGLKEFSGPYSTMIEVQWIYRDKQKLGDVEYLLQHFRSIICRLQEVDPRKLSHEQKLAFWINIHNSLVMHAFLAFGIPHNSVKRVLLLLKAAYIIGGHKINAHAIQSSILGCRMSCPGQWLRKLIPLRSKFKTGDKLQEYAIGDSEPLLHFALSSGSHSDPAVRVYTAKKIFQELEMAKDEYIRATVVGLLKNEKIMLPKLVESFSKDMKLSRDEVVKTVRQAVSESLRKSIRKSVASNKSPKVIEWVPHNFSFRYLISKDLVQY